MQRNSERERSNPEANAYQIEDLCLGLRGRTHFN